MHKKSSAEQLEIIEEFVRECTDLVNELEPDIIRLGEHIPDRSGPLSVENRQTVNSVFRLFHSIKGSACFLDFCHIAQVAHAAENLLDKIRTEEIRVAPEHIDLLCQTIDFVREALDHVAAHQNDGGMAAGGEKHSLRLQAAVATSPAEVISLEGEAEASPESAPEMAITQGMGERFTQESNELLEALERGLLQMAKHPDRTDTLAEVFRHIHRIKGNSGFFGFADIEKLSHRMETVLDAARSGYQFRHGKPAETLLSMVDIMRCGLTDISRGGKGMIEGVDLYAQLLDDIFAGDKATSRQGVEPAAPPQIVKTEAPEKILSSPVAQWPRQPAGSASGPEPPASAAAGKRQDIRVDLAKLDALIDLIGEMVIAENMLLHSPDLQGLTLENFNKSAQQMSKLLKEAQEVTMTIRMIPVAGLFHRMARLVHDLSRKSGKKVDLHTAGMETELDKTVIETITDPLIHLLRNSMDHGLEPPAERRQAGKEETGTLMLAARHEEGEVWITLEDDGRGLNREKIIHKALARGLIEGDGSALTEQEVVDLIFLPGFTTADQVTDISGRGVGMDVVRQNLAAIAGKIDIHAKAGKGTRTLLRIPLTMAIIDGMLVRVGRARYIIPMLSIKESFRPAASAITVSPDGQELVRVRENLYPVLRLHQLHRIVPDCRRLVDGILVALESRSQTICLFVDEILGQQQTVIKRLSDYIHQAGNVPGVTGCTILGDGDVSLILDAMALSELAVGREEHV